MEKRFLLFSLIFSLVSLIFLIYPEVSFAAQSASVKTGTPGVGLTTANATGTVLGSGSATSTGGVGFVWGTVSTVYYSTSSSFTVDTYTTSSDFNLSTTTLSKGTVYYHKAYASTTVSTVYGSEVSFLTGIDAPSSLAIASRDTNSLSLSWVKGTGANNTIIRYRTDTYPTSITDGTQATSSDLTSFNVAGLAVTQAYYFRAWSSTTAAALSTSSDSYSQISGATIGAFVASGARGYVAPTVFSDSLVINAGAVTTKSREVILTLKAGDANLMTICNRSDLLNCSLENYATTKTWTLTEGDGVKTVYAKFLSPDGLNSDLVSDTITLKTTVVEEEVPTPTPTTPTEEVPASPAPAPATPAPAEKPISQMTIAELQVKIAEILSQIKVLQAQLAELKEAVTFEVNLKYGDKGDEVVKLQEALIKEGLLAQGLNTGWFGSLTKAAVIKFQEKYASEILIPSGLSKGTGFVFSATRAKLNKLLGK